MNTPDLQFLADPCEPELHGTGIPVTPMQSREQKITGFCVFLLPSFPEYGNQKTRKRNLPGQNVQILDCPEQSLVLRLPYSVGILCIECFTQRQPFSDRYPPT